MFRSKNGQKLGQMKKNMCSCTFLESAWRDEHDDMPHDPLAENVAWAKNCDQIDQIIFRQNTLGVRFGSFLHQMFTDELSVRKCNQNTDIWSGSVPVFGQNIVHVFWVKEG